MKISQEAREAAEQLFYLACDGGDKVHLEEVMQSLINSTLKRAAGVADMLAKQLADAENAGNDEAEEAWHGGCAHGCKRAATAIRQLIEE